MLSFFCVLHPHDGTLLVQRRLDGEGMRYSLFLRTTCHAAPVHLYRRTRDLLSDTVAGYKPLTHPDPLGFFTAYLDSSH